MRARDTVQAEHLEASPTATRGILSAHLLLTWRCNLQKRDRQQLADLYGGHVSMAAHEGAHVGPGI